MLAGVFPGFFLGCFSCCTRCGTGDRGLRRPAGHPWAGGWVTLRAADAGDWDLGLEIILGDTVDFHCSLMGIGCVCEGALMHPQLPGCLSLSPNRFLSLSRRRRLIPFPGKIFVSCAGEIQWLLAASITQTGMSWHAGLFVRKTDVSAATEVLQRASPSPEKQESVRRVARSARPVPHTILPCFGSDLFVSQVPNHATSCCHQAWIRPEKWGSKCMKGPSQNSPGRCLWSSRI